MITINVSHSAGIDARVICRTDHAARKLVESAVRAHGGPREYQLDEVVLRFRCLDGAVVTAERVLSGQTPRPAGPLSDEERAARSVSTQWPLVDALLRTA